MAKSVSVYTGRVSVPKKTSIGGKHAMIKSSSMNKNKKNSYKKYKGQGR